MGLPKANTNDLGIRDALYVEDTCCEESDFSNQTLENKLEDSFVGMEFQVCELDGHAVTLEAEVCEENAKTITSTLPVEPPFEVHNNSTLDVEVCVDDCTHDVVD